MSTREIWYRYLAISPSVICRVMQLLLWPGRISDFGIPFPNWCALLSRHQLGATRLTGARKVVRIQIPSIKDDMYTGGYCFQKNIIDLGTWIENYWFPEALS